MISSRSEYRYLSADDVARVPVRGNILPVRLTPNPLGEDVLFLNEAMYERMQELRQPAAKVQADRVHVPRFDGIANVAEPLGNKHRGFSYTGDWPSDVSGFSLGGVFLDPEKWPAKAAQYQNWTVLLDWDYLDPNYSQQAWQAQVREIVNSVMRDMGISWYDSAADEQSGTISQTHKGFSSPLWFDRKWSVKLGNRPTSSRWVGNPLVDFPSMRNVLNAFDDYSRCHLTARKNLPLYQGGGEERHVNSDGTSWTTPFAASLFDTTITEYYWVKYWSRTSTSSAWITSTHEDTTTYDSVYLSLGDAVTVDGTTIPLTAGTIASASIFVIVRADAYSSNGSTYDYHKGRLWGKLVPLAKAAKALADLGSGVETWKCTNFTADYLNLALEPPDPPLTGVLSASKDKLVGTYSVPYAIIDFVPRTSGWGNSEE